MSSSLKFPIPDWGEEVFQYPGTNINGETIIKSKKKKRKNDNEDMVGKSQPDKESPQRNSKKMKSDKTVTIPDNKKLNVTKEQKNTKATKISSHQENNQNVPSTKKKRKRNRKNNKYKELNERQKQERVAKTGAAVGKGESQHESTIVKIKENQDTTQLITGKEITQQQSEQHKDIKKKKKKSKLLHKEDNDDNQVEVTEKGETQDDETELVKKKKKKKRKEKLLNNSHNNTVKDNTDDQEEATVTSPHNISQDVNKIETPHSQTKKKKSTKKLTDAILLNDKETETSQGGETHQNAVGEKAKKKKKGKKTGEESTERMENLGTSPLDHESEMGGTEDEAKRKKKRREEVQESGKLSNGKDSVSDTKRTKLKKQKSGGKSSKKMKEVEEGEQDEEEEMVFDGDEECSESFKEDLGALLSSLNFGDLKTKGSKKRKSNAEDNSDAEMNDGGGRLETESSVVTEGKEEDLKKKRKKKKKKKVVEEEEGKEENIKSSPEKINVEKSDATRNEHTTPVIKKVPKFDRGKVAMLLEEAARMERERPSRPTGNSLKERMEGRLMAARFRMVNQELYTKSSNEAKELFKKDPTAFDIYHQGYQAQVKQWPVNPLDVIIKWLSNRPKELVVADMGCGEGTLSQHVPQKRVYSLDLVACNPWVTPCDMAHTPLAAASVDVVVFCLSLMGTNIKDFIVEANRILKPGGIMKIAEVESRFTDVKDFEKHLVKYGFHCTARDTSHKYFFILDFKKNHKLKKTVILPDIILKPCLYKKR